MLALYIILGIVAFILAVLSIPASVYAYYDEDFILYVKYLFFKFYIYPPQDKPKKEKAPKKPKEEKPKEEEPKEEKKKGDNFIVTFYKNQGVSGILDLLGNVMAILKKSGKSLLRAFHIRHLYIKILVSSTDAAQTAIDYGKMCAKVYPSIGYITSKIKSKNVKINVSPDFLGNKNKGSFSTKINIIPRTLVGAVIVLAIKLGKQLIKILISNSKEAAKKSEAKKAAREKANAQKNKAAQSVKIKPKQADNIDNAEVQATKTSNQSSENSENTDKKEL